MPSARNPARTSARTSAIAVAVLAIGLFALMDALLKKLVTGADTLGVLLWRSAVGTALLVIPYLMTRVAWPTVPALRLHVVRGVLGAGTAFAFFWGLGRMPLAEAIALSFIAPLIALFMAAWWLKEELSRAAVAGSLAALAGVGVMVASRLGAEGAARELAGVGAVLVAALLYAAALVVGRRQALVAGAWEGVLMTTMVTLMLYGAAAAWRGTPVPMPAIGVLTAAAALGVAAQTLMLWAYARADTQTLAPLEYTAFVWAAGLGMVMFGEGLAVSTLIGTALIVGGSLYAAWRGAKRAS